MDRSTVYQTIIVLALASLVVMYAFELDWMVYVAAGFLAIGTLSYWISSKIAWVWIKFSEILGNVNGRIILGIIFFLVLTPLSFLYRAVKKDALKLRRKADGSYYATRDHVYSAEEIKKPW